MKNTFRNILILLIIAVTMAVIYWLIINYYDDKNRTDNAHVEGNIVPVLARTDGFVESVFVDDDEYVKEGTVMIILDTSDLRLQLDQAVNALAIANTNLIRAKSAIAVSKAEYEIATSAIDAQKANLKTSESNYERNSVLKDKGVVSVQMYELSEENYIKSKINLQSSYERQSQAKLALADASHQEELAQQNIITQTNQVEILRKNISYATVRAPVSGMTSKRKIQKGQMVRTGNPAFFYCRVGKFMGDC
jgi:membrane fusion protein (multidrug efflux system)